MEDEIQKAMRLLQKADEGFRAAGLTPNDATRSGEDLDDDDPAAKLQSIAKLRSLLEGDAPALASPSPEHIKELKRLRLMDDSTLNFGSEMESSHWDATARAEDAALSQAFSNHVTPKPGAKKKKTLWDDLPPLFKERMSLSLDAHHPLWAAVAQSNVDRLSYLLDQPAYNVNHRFRALWNSTLLHVAAELPDVEVATLLVKRGAAIDALNAYDQTPLHLAAYRGEIPMVERLVDMGAPIEDRSWDGSTALHIACFQGQNKTAETLVGLGASLNSTNRNGENALYLAELGGFVELANFLRRCLGLPPKDVEETRKWEDYQRYKEAAINRLASELERKLNAGTKARLEEEEEGPSAPAELGCPQALRDKIRKMVERQADEEARSKAGVHFSREE